MPTLSDALALAGEVHRNQADKAGQPYIQHVLRVVSYLRTEREKIAGALHDVVEKSDYGFDDLRQRGYADDVVEALDCLTKRTGEDYAHYIERVKANRLATRVKLADLRDNMRMDRLTDPSPLDWERYDKYVQAERLLRKRDVTQHEQH